MSVSNLAGRFVDVNEAFVMQLGYSREETIGHTSLEVGMVDAAGREAREVRLAAMLREGTLRDASVTLFTRDGREREMIVFVEPVEIGEQPLFVTTYVDVTERRRAEREVERALNAEREASEAFRRTLSALMAAEKLASLGQMVAGVAHEINNPLAFVSNNVAVIERDVDALSAVVERYQRADALLAEARPELAQSIDEAAAAMDLPYVLDHLPTLIARTREGLRRIEQIVRALRDFARVDRAELSEVDLNAGVVTTVDIMRWQARRKSVELVLELGDMPLVPCHGGKINQVVMNLLSNAIDATPSGSKVTVRTSADRASARIDVHDEGPGVPDTMQT